MQDTTGSVPDVESRGRECAALSASGVNASQVTEVSCQHCHKLYGEHGAGQFDDLCMTYTQRGGYKPDGSGNRWSPAPAPSEAVKPLFCPTCDRLKSFCNCGPTPRSTPSRAREHLLEQLIAAASDLASKHIFRKDPGLPFCQVCLMSGINGRPIPHSKSCEVGRVFSAIEELQAPVETYRIELDPVEHPTATELA